MKKCTFCGEEKDGKLIEGKDGGICSKCLSTCNDILKMEENQMKKNEENRGKNASESKNIVPSEIKKEIDKIVIGQDEAKKQLIMEFYKRQKSNNSSRNNVFLLGNSGVGKTFLVRNLAKVVGVPFVEFDSTTFSETGFKGRDVSEIIDELYVTCGGSKEETERAIVFIDEIDKVVTSSNADGINKVQHGLLKMIEGATYTVQKGRGPKSVIDVIDTSKILFVVAGACVGIEEIMKKRLTNTGSIGFSKQTKIQEDTTKDICAEDLISFGFIPEFIGRFPVIVRLNELSKENYHSILMDSEGAVIPEYIALFEKEEIELSFIPCIIDELIDAAISSPLGVRGLKNSLVKTLNDLLFESLLENKTKILVQELRS